MLEQLIRCEKQICKKKDLGRKIGTHLNEHLHFTFISMRLFRVNYLVMVNYKLRNYLAMKACKYSLKNITNRILLKILVLDVSVYFSVHL